MMYEISINADYLRIAVTLTINHPDGTQNYEGVGGSIGEALQDLADNAQCGE